MATYKAAVLEATGQPIVIKDVQLPNSADPGTAIIRVLATAISPNVKKILRGEFHTPLQTPTTPSYTAIGRVWKVGPDAARLQEGQLILYDFWITARDDRNAFILQGFMGVEPRLDAYWRNGTYAEYACVPLEKCWPLNEQLLTKTLGYSFADLTYLGILGIAFAGLFEIGAQPGDTIIVAPATGHFGGAAVHAAIALGMRVIAAGRNKTMLAKIESVFKSSGRISTVALTGDVELDSKALIEASGSKAGVDKYIDYSPPQSVGSKHIESCIRALKPFGRVAIMGNVFGNVGIPYSVIMQKSLRLQGRCMFDYEHGEQMIKLVESGLLKLGAGDCSGINVHSFKLKDIQEAFDRAEKDSGWGNLSVIEP